jgi:hypothetical protein
MTTRTSQRYSRNYQLARQEIRSVVNFFINGGFEESIRVADYFEARRKQGKALPELCICDSQD